MKHRKTLVAFVAVSAFSLTVLAAGSASAQGQKTKVVFVVETSEPVPTAAHIVSTTAPVGAAAVVTVAPPAPKVETKGPPPTTEHVWVSGHWRWDPGTKAHVWIPGHWEKHKHGHVWVHSHWVSYGGKYHFVAGYWRKT